MKLYSKILLVGILALLALLVSPAAATVAIPKLDLQGETVTIVNNGPASVDMTGWYLYDLNNIHKYTFPNSFQLGPNAQVIVHTGAGADSSTDLYMNRGAAIWNNDGDVATLWDRSGTKIADSNGYIAPDVVTPTITTQVPISLPPTPVNPNPTPPVTPAITFGPPSVTPYPTVPLPTLPLVTPTSPVVILIPYPTTVATVAPASEVTPIPVVQPASPASRFGQRRYIVGAVPKSPPNGISVGIGIGSISTRGRTALGTGVATGVKPPTGRFVRWSPAARWKAGLK